MSSKPRKSDRSPRHLANGKGGEAWCYNNPKTVEFFCTRVGMQAVLNFTISKKTLKKLSELP